MHHFDYKDGELHAEDVKIADLAAQFGTPLYVYSAATLRRHFTAFDSAFACLPHLTCYSVKANSNVCLLRLLAGQGAGMDIVSGGELYRALAAGVAPEKIVYSGVGKRDDEIRFALETGILMFNVESLGELERIDALAGEMGKTARVAPRLNPDVDPGTHPYISTGLKKNKFGLDIDASLEFYKKAKELAHVIPAGLDCHIGSQLTSIDPFLEALERVLQFNASLRELGIKIEYLDLGGGLGIAYDQETPPHPEAYGLALSHRLKGLPLTVIFEPGRVIAGNAGILVSRVVYTKTTPSKHFVILDAGMNDLVRPSLYQSFHAVREVAPKGRAQVTADLVGPICESGDFLAKDREIAAVAPGELVVFHSAGAYGFSMSSNYNSRPRAAEVIVDGSRIILARRRETYEDLIKLESLGC